LAPFRLAVVSIGRVHFDFALATELAQQFRQRLEEHGYDLVGPSEIITDLAGAEAAARQLAGAPADLMVVLQTTFADSQMITALTDALDMPVFIWAPPDQRTGARLRLGSFTGINLSCHALNRQGKSYGFVYGSYDDSTAWNKLAAYAAAGNIRRKLKSTCIGVVGERPAGMDTCDLDAAELDRWTGVQIQRIDLHQAFERIRAADANELTAVRQRLDRSLGNLDSLDQKPLGVTLSTYVALKEMAIEKGMASLAVRCWPEFFTELGGAACGAISLLSDEGIPATCEADINGAVSHLILQWLSDGPAFSTDVVEVDTAKDEIVLWHCGQAPLSLADPTVQPRGTIHSNRRVPLLMDFPLKPGRVTLARLSRAGGHMQLVAGRGEMLSAPQAYSGTSGVFRFERPAQEFMDRLLSNGIEHHMTLAYGDHMETLQILAGMLKLPLLAL
jgi:L-fucose isomerase-like protein